MPARLVILAEEVLFQGGAEAPGRAWFDPLARLTHAGHPVAVILAGSTTGSTAPQQLQQLAHEAGGQVVAFFHRAQRDADLAVLLDEVTARWRVDPAQVHGVFSRAEDLNSVAAYGATAIAIADRLEAETKAPTGCLMYADLASFVDTLLEDTDSGA
jgi:hypothetical protein